MKTVLPGLLAFLFGTLVLAHHNYRLNFDDSVEVTIEGVVTEFEWVNPHVIIHLDAVDADGKVTSWVMPTATPGVAGRNGMTSEPCPPGTGRSSRAGRHGTVRIRCAQGRSCLRMGVAFRCIPPAWEWAVSPDNCECQKLCV